MDDYGWFYSEGSHRAKCACGSDWRLHCKSKCSLYRCSNENCTGVFNYRKKRFSILKRHLPEVA